MKPESIKDIMKRLSQDFESPNKKVSGEHFVSEVEIEKLITSLAHSRKDEEFTLEEATQIVRWAVGARADIGMLELVLKGLAQVTINNGEVSFRLSPGVELKGDLDATED